MKSEQFASKLRPMAALNEALGEREAAVVFSALADRFSALGAMSVANALKPLKTAALAPAPGGPQIGVLASQLPALGEITAAMAPKGVQTDIAALSAAILAHPEAPLEGFLAALGAAPAKAAAALPAEQIEDYRARLAAAELDADAFAAVIDALTADPVMTPKAMVALAKAYAHSRAKSKPAALKDIKARGGLALRDAARDAANAGRSAA